MATNPVAVTVIYSIIVVVLYAFITHLRRLRLPASIPWAGLRNGPFARERAHLRELVHGKEILAEGYFKYNKKGKPFATPNFNFSLDVMLPLEYAQWIDKQQEDVLSAREGQLYFLSKYTFSHSRLFQDTLEDNLSRTQQILRLPTLQTQVLDELVVALGDAWGHDNQWKAVNPYQTMFGVVARTANRAFVGKSLCRSTDFLGAVEAYVDSFATQGVLIRFLVPNILKPVFGRLLAVPVHYRYHRLMSHLKPLAEDLITEHLSGSVSNDEETFAKWLVAAAQVHPNPEERTATVVAGQLTSAEFAPLHTLTFAITNTLLDLLSSQEAQDHLERLRKEGDGILKGDNSTQWTKAMVQGLELADSTIRESQRISRTSGKAMMRRVVAKGGVNLPDGSHLPCGTYIGLSVEGAHMDGDIYEAPEEFRPWRFVRGTKATNGVPKKLVTTGPDYLSFGHGKHACPGRALVAQILTVLLARMVTEYDIQSLKEKPIGHHVSDHYKPPVDATIYVRRRIRYMDGGMHYISRPSTASGGQRMPRQ